MRGQYTKYSAKLQAINIFHNYSYKEVVEPAGCQARRKFNSLNPCKQPGFLYQ